VIRLSVIEDIVIPFVIILGVYFIVLKPFMDQHNLKVNMSGFKLPEGAMKRKIITKNTFDRLLRDSILACKRNGRGWGEKLIIRTSRETPKINLGKFLGSILFDTFHIFVIGKWPKKRYMLIVFNYQLLSEFTREVFIKGKGLVCIEGILFVIPDPGEMRMHDWWEQRCKNAILVLRDMQSTVGIANLQAGAVDVAISGSGEYYRTSSPDEEPEIRANERPERVEDEDY